MWSHKDQEDTQQTGNQEQEVSTASSLLDTDKPQSILRVDPKLLGS